ncbi:hypothetical protein LTR15_012508 [Elasticomyces elasticus]|nr:hypothetical protein LTR15_012508 [Elasticomyces elasticus]
MAQIHQSVIAFDIARSQIRVANDADGFDKWSTHNSDSPGGAFTGVGKLRSALAGLGHVDVAPVWISDMYGDDVQELEQHEDRRSCAALKTLMERPVHDLLRTTSKAFVGVPGDGHGLSGPSDVMREAITQSAPRGVGVMLVNEQRAALIGYLKVERSLGQQDPRYSYYTLVHFGSTTTEVTSFEIVSSSRETSDATALHQFQLARLFTELCWLVGDSHHQSNAPTSSAHYANHVEKTETLDAKYATSTIDAWGRLGPHELFPGTIQSQVQDFPAQHISEPRRNNYQHHEEARFDLVRRAMAKVRETMLVKRPAVPITTDHAFVIHGDDPDILSLRWKARECLQMQFDPRIVVKFADVESGQSPSGRAPKQGRGHQCAQQPSLSRKNHRLPSVLATIENPAPDIADEIDANPEDLGAIAIIKDWTIVRRARVGKAPTYFTKRGHLLSRKRHIATLKDQGGRFLINEDERSSLIDHRYRDANKSRSTTRFGTVQPAGQHTEDVKNGAQSSPAAPGRSSQSWSERNDGSGRDDQAAEIQTVNAEEEGRPSPIPSTLSVTRVLRSDQKSEAKDRLYELNARNYCALIRATSASPTMWLTSDARGQAVDRVLQEAVPPLSRVTKWYGTEALHDRTSILKLR